MEYGWEEGEGAEGWNALPVFEQAVLRAAKLAQFESGSNSGELVEGDPITVTWTPVQNDQPGSGTTDLVHVLSDNTYINGVTHWADIKADAMKAGYFDTVAFYSLSDIDQWIVEALIDTQSQLAFSVLGLLQSLLLCTLYQFCVTTLLLQPRDLHFDLLQVHRQ